ncbi:MAG: ATP-dependent helicase C-terminal domain-containing protein, partial [Acidimicrobiales bacterium]
AQEPLLAVAAVEGLADDIRIIAAAPLDDDELLAVHGDRVDERMKGGWDRRARDVVFEEQKRFGALVLERRPVSDPPADAVISALREGLRREGLKLLPWSDPTIRFRQRLAFLHRVDPDHWPAVDDDELLADIDDWLTPYLSGARRRTDLDRIDLKAALSHRVGGRRTRDIDRLAPSHLTVPSGSRIPIDYSDESRPVLAVRLQELFGLTETPSVADGTVTLVVHLLSPAHRPVQVTTDLASFWADGYPEVRRELRGRYPRHDWPEDPTTAAPTNRARRRGR